MPVKQRGDKRRGKDSGGKRGNTVRRSIALKRQLVEEVLAAAPPGIAGNWNRIVNQALCEFVARKKKREFADAMACMARDPQVRALSDEISEGFRDAEEDGLSG